jgi:hypothetical protein
MDRVDIHDKISDFLEGSGELREQEDDVSSGTSPDDAYDMGYNDGKAEGGVSEEVIDKITDWITDNFTPKAQ